MLLEARDLAKHYPVRGGPFAPRRVVRAVDGVSLAVDRGRTLALVGESGCGKTTVGRLLLRLVEPTRGTVLLEGEDVTAATPRELRALRRHMQMVFQDPMGSLDPRMTVHDIVAEPLRLHREVPSRELRGAVAERLERVGLDPGHARRFPHQLSGGQRQRVGLARALALDPRLLVLDEPTSALDVSVQARILNLLRDLQHRLGLAYLFISHDLAVVRQMADRVAVMYLGEIVEQGPTEQVFRNPQHPYTQALLAAVPKPDPEAPRRRVALRGDVPSPAAPPAACRFHPRCPRFRAGHCDEAKPPLEPKDGTEAACHYPGPPERWGEPREVPPRPPRGA